MLLSFPLSDKSLTPQELLHPFSKSSKFWANQLMDWLDVPDSVWIQIRNCESYSSEDEKRMAVLQYCLQTLPGVSWRRIAGVLWRLEEHTALETIRQYLPGEQSVHTVLHICTRIVKVSHKK